MEDEKLAVVSLSTGKDYLGFLTGDQLKRAIDVSAYKGEGNYIPFSEQAIRVLVLARVRKTDIDISLANCDFSVENASIKVLDYLTHCNNVMAECKKTTLDNLIADRFSKQMK